MPCFYSNTEVYRRILIIYVSPDIEKEAAVARQKVVQAKFLKFLILFVKTGTSLIHFVKASLNCYQSIRF